MLSEAGFVLEREEDWSELMLPTLRRAIVEWVEDVQGQIAALGLQKAMYKVMREVQKLALTADGVLELGAFIARKPAGHVDRAGSVGVHARRFLGQEAVGSR